MKDNPSDVIVLLVGICGRNVVLTSVHSPVVEVKVEHAVANAERTHQT